MARRGRHFRRRLRHDAFCDLYGFKPTDPTNGSAPTATALTTYATPTAAGGTSGIVVDNVSGAAQASSIYFTTQATSTTVCGSTAAYCAIKLTQAALKSTFAPERRLNPRFGARRLTQARPIVFEALAQVNSGQITQTREGQK